MTVFVRVLPVWVVTHMQHGLPWQMEYYSLAAAQAAVIRNRKFYDLESWITAPEDRS